MVLSAMVAFAAGESVWPLAELGNETCSTRTRSPLAAGAKTTLRWNETWSVCHRLNSWWPQTPLATGVAPHPLARVGLATRLSSMTALSLTPGPFR